MKSEKRHRREVERRRQRRVKKHELKIRIQEISAKFLNHVRLLTILGCVFQMILPLLPVKKQGKEHTKLTLEERQWIYCYKSQGFGIREIARRIGRVPSTVSRELRRNKPPGYCRDSYSAAKHAHDRALNRRRQSRAGRVRLKSWAIQGIVYKAIKGGLTPKLISARLFMEEKIRLSHEAIYRWIYKIERVLIPYLPRQGRSYRRNAKKRSRVLPRPAKPKLSIEKRPKAANERLEFGHWEFDTIVSKQSKACLLVVQERVSRFFFVVKLPSCSADEASSAVIRLLRPLAKDMVKSLTCDNGSENWGYETIS